MNTTQTSLNSSQESIKHAKLSLEPSRRQKQIQELHKRDMQNIQFCQLNFGTFLRDKKVRTRAIEERVEAI